MINQIQMIKLSAAFCFACTINLTAFNVSAQPIPQTLIQKIRSFLGINPPVAAGGSRSNNNQLVCLLSPWPTAEVGVSKPVLQTSAPLTEIRIEKDKQIVWQRRASTEKAIVGAIPWPLLPLNPGEEFTLKLRPEGSAGGDFAIYLLRVADQATLDANQRQINSLGINPRDWINFVANLKPENRSILPAILSSSKAPSELLNAFKCEQESPPQRQN
jgi:hypothetical protein